MSVPTHAQDSEPAPPAADTGEIDGDLAGVVPPAQKMTYAPGALEAYEQQMRAYELTVAAESAAQKRRAETFRRQRAAYESELAAYLAARRKYESERATWEAEINRRR